MRRHKPKVIGKPHIYLDDGQWWVALQFSFLYAKAIRGVVSNRNKLANQFVQAKNNSSEYKYKKFLDAIS